MLKFTSFRTLVRKFFYCGKLLLNTYIMVVLICHLFVKDCLKSFLWVSYRLKERFICIEEELCGDNLWQALLEEADIDHLNPVILQPKGNCTYLCQSCYDSMLFNQIASSRILNIRNSDDETSEIRNTLVSVSCQCEFKEHRQKEASTSPLKVLSSLFKEASTSPLKSPTPESVKFYNKIYDVSREKSETKLKTANIKTPLSSPACLMPISETPIKIPRKSRLELMFSEEKHFSSPEKESLFRRNWNKWKRVSNFKKRNVEENILLDQASTQMETDILEEKSGVFITIQTPEVDSCCNMLCHLKKFNQKGQKSSVTYKKF